MKASEQNDFMDFLPIGLYRSTIEGKLLQCNRALVRLFGFGSKSELLSYPVAELYVEKEDRGALILALMENSSVEERPVRLKKSDGTPFRGALTASGVFDEDGTLVYIDGALKEMHHDPSDDSTFDEQLKREKFQGVLEMAGGVAHKLNQPLTIISNLTDKLMADLSPENTYYHQVEKIRQQILQLTEIARKISKINKYKAMEYVAGIKIIDIDRAS